MRQGLSIRIFVTTLGEMYATVSSAALLCGLGGN